MSVHKQEKKPIATIEDHPNEKMRSRKDGQKKISVLSSEQTASEAKSHLERNETPKSTRRAYLIFGTTVVLGLAAWGGYAFFMRNVETTDDAFIDADVVALSPRVGGRVIRISVNDNQWVKKNDLLVEIDPDPYEARLKQTTAELAVARANAQAAEAEVTIATANAEGNLSVAEASVSNAKISIGGAEARVTAAEASLERSEAQVRKAEADLARARQLAESGAISGGDLDHRERETEVALAQLRETKAALTLAREQSRVARSRVAETKGRLRQSEPVPALLDRARAQLELARARVGSAEAAVELARIDLESTRVTATVPGRITRLATRPGQMVQPGQLLLYLVPDERYVVANFKETQVGRMKPGQKVEVQVDAYPDRTFPAEIESLMAGTGSRFSLLPANNATGNFVKVVQRIPVRIDWQGNPPGVNLAPGMSALVKVHVSEDANMASVQK